MFGNELNQNYYFEDRNSVFEGLFTIPLSSHFTYFNDVYICSLQTSIKLSTFPASNKFFTFQMACFIILRSLLYD